MALANQHYLNEITQFPLVFCRQGRVNHDVTGQ
jgi:hypothetical protein